MHPDAIGGPTGPKRLVWIAIVAIGILAVLPFDRAQARPEGAMAPNAEAIIADWPAKPQEATRAMIGKYGQPDELTPTHLIWRDDGPWKKTVASKEEIPHSFPVAHTDLLLQEIHYRVPPDKFDDLARYDGSVIVERTKGTMAARCDKEEMNFLALNLANDVVKGSKTVDAARDYYARAAMEFMKGKKDPYTQGLQFSVARGGTGDPDQPASVKKEMPRK